MQKLYRLFTCMVLISCSICLQGCEAPDTASAEAAADVGEYTASGEIYRPLESDLPLTSSASHFAFGDKVDGLEIGLMAGLAEYRVGQAVDLTMVIHNTSSQLKEVAGNGDSPSLALNDPIVFVNIEREGSSLQCKYTAGSYPVGCAGRLYQYRVEPHRKKRSLFSILVETDGTLLKDDGMSLEYRLDPGKYTMQLEYLGRKGKTLKSNKVRVSITGAK